MFLGRYKSVLTGCIDGNARVFRSEYLNNKKNRGGGSNTDKDTVRMRSSSPSKASIEKTTLRRDNIVDLSPHRDYGMV